MQDNPLKGILLMNVAMFLLAGMDGISKTLAADYAVPQILSVRFLIFCLFALAIARPRSLRAAFRSKHPYLQIARSLIITIEVGVFILAFRYLPLADTHAIAGIAPLLVTALAVPFLGEKVGMRRWTAIGIGFLGLLIIVRPGIGVFNPAALIALAGAAAFGATMAIQGPLSNYGAGLSIILSRPFAVGDTICVKNVSGTVDDIKLAATVLIGEDKERITIPNKEIVGEVIVNSNDNRIVETRIAIGFSEDSEKAIDTLRTVIRNLDGVVAEPRPLVGIHDFTYGGVVLGLRFWVPGLQYFQSRYSVNEALLKGLRDAGISLQPISQTSIAVPPLSADLEV